MISKELLSEVLDIEIEEIGKLVEGSLLSFRYPTHWGYCNTHELAHKCKEWSVKRGYTLESGLTWCNYYANKDFTNDRPYLDYVVEDTEPEAIFKACEWILKESK